MGQNAWTEAFDKITEGANSLKEVALNRHDRDFEVWQRQARNLLLRHAPVKIPAFDEIRFASDFFLGKPDTEQIDINDRIALHSDIDQALELLEMAKGQVVEELRLKKSRERIKGGASFEYPEQTKPSTSSEPEVAPTPQVALIHEGMDGLPGLVEASDLTQREKEEALEEIDRVRQALEQNRPDWDRIKRTIKFLLDFDKSLALTAVPLILKRYHDLTHR